MLAAATILGLAAGTPHAPAPPQDDHPLAHDRTGIAWALPFAKARAAAREREHLLLIKPVAFGTTPDGGW